MAWDNIKEKKPIPAKSIDGYVRTPAEEAQLNKTFAGVIQTRIKKGEQDGR